MSNKKNDVCLNDIISGIFDDLNKLNNTDEDTDEDTDECLDFDDNFIISYDYCKDKDEEDYEDEDEDCEDEEEMYSDSIVLPLLYLEIPCIAYGEHSCSENAEKISILDILRKISLPSFDDERDYYIRVLYDFFKKNDIFTLADMCEII